MSLTGSTFQWLTIMAAIAATIAVIVLWNRIRGPRPVKLASRIGLLTASYVTAAVAILVSINIAYGGLIATWGDLFANLNPPTGSWHPHYRGHHYGHAHGLSGYFGAPHRLPQGAPGHILPPPSPSRPSQDTQRIVNRASV